MTRINVVPVSELTDQHLLAEHRELTRIPNGILSGKLKVHYDDRPSEYTLGAGHVKFFTDKLNWLRIRYHDLHIECQKRGFKPEYKWPINVFIHPDAYAAWVDVTPEALKINRDRIRERWPKNARWYREPASLNMFY